MKRVAIAGFAREGQSTLKFLKSAPDYRGAEIWVLDKKRIPKIPRGIRTRFGKNYLDGLSGFDIVFRTPGIPYQSREIQRAVKAGVAVSSATKLFFNEIRKLPKKPLVIGITGTKGKGTTSTLLYRILLAAKKNVFLGGNIGTSPLELLPALQKNRKAEAIIILELSSFQLQDLKTSPDIGVVLDVFPDHQDAHKNLEEYYGAKANIAAFQGARDNVFFFEDNKLSTGIARHGQGKKNGVDQHKFRLFAEMDLKIPGHHNFKNAVMAAAVARTLRVPDALIAKAVKEFGGNPHRLELVRKLGQTSFYNDSASTNPQTSAAAVAAFPKNTKILILGGQDKKLDYTPLAQAVKGSMTSLAVLYGENKGRIRKALAISNVPMHVAASLKQAVDIARTFAEAPGIAAKHPVVLFSPGAASFDMFKNYADRGDQFRAIIRKLK